MSDSQKHLSNQEIQALLTGQNDADFSNLPPAVMTHLETCVDCQRNMETVSADSSVWQEISHILSDEILPLDPGLLDTEGANDSNEQTTIYRASATDSSQSGHQAEVSSLLIEHLLAPPSHPEMLGPHW